ncbi:MAG TPA: hypothetical protein VHO91_21270 [Rhodopila sp.]|nr:hypothetical protein [Rhodopila sp.]
MRLPRIVLLLSCLAAVHPALVQATEAPACDIQPDVLAPTVPLPHVAAALTRKQINILALGSGSTVGITGQAAGPALAYRTPGGSFPYRMADALQAARPDVKVNLSVKGGRNMTASAMLPILRDELAHGHVDLVLWQTGTVEAVHGTRPDALRSDLVDGIDMADGANADLVLIDLQFSRFLRANVDVTPYESVLTQVAGTESVGLFPRWTLTQDWVSNGQIDLERVSPKGRDSAIALLNTCLGSTLTRYILGAAAEH